MFLAVGVVNDASTHITLRGKQTTLWLQRLDRVTSFVVVFKNSADETLCSIAIERTTRLIKSGVWQIQFRTAATYTCVQLWS